MTLPVRSSTGCGGGCSPTASCPAPEPVTYEVTLPGGWNPEYAAGFVPFPLLAFVTTPDAIAPVPPLPLLSELAFSVPVAAPASTFPADDAWQVVNPFAEASFVGLLLPLAIVPPLFFGSPIWFRFRFRDADGCDSAVYAFFPDGLPETATEPVSFQVFYGPESEPIVVDVEAAPNDEDEGPQQDVVLTVSPVCPAPAAFVPVGPACGAEAIPVTFAGQGDLRQQDVIFHQVNAGETLDLDSSSRLVIRRMDTDAPSAAQVTAPPSGTFYSLAPGQELELVSADGFWLNRVTVTSVGDAVIQIAQVVVPTS